MRTGRSSRPEGFHPQPLTKPGLRLSPHTAFHGDRDASSQKQPLSVVALRFLLVAQLTKTTHLAMSSSWLPAHYRRFNAVGSEVAHPVSPMLATVRRSNWTCGFPASSFHEDSCFRDAIEGIS